MGVVSQSGINALTGEDFIAFIREHGIREFYVAGADATACIKSTAFNMAKAELKRIVVRLFCSGKGSGAAFLFAILWLAGVGVCVIFQADLELNQKSREIIKGLS